MPRRPRAPPTPRSPDRRRGTDPDEEHLALRTATQLAATLMRVCSDTTSE
ncbi:hypothetical protein ABH920_008525, partial [Catenulispora sp. EB89]